MKNCIVGQSGGPTAVINASMCGVLKAASKSDKINKVYGVVNGIQGVLKENFIDCEEIYSSDYKMELLKQTPASYLGSCRYKLPDINVKGDYEKIFQVFDKYDIGYFYYIGGNDSMDTVFKLSEYAKLISYDIKIIGIPKTIDNDLTDTDHTPGFGSAAKFVASAVREIGLDSDVYDLKSVTIVEIMGRNSGFLTAASALARNEALKAPHLIYLPESVFSDEKLFADVKNLFDSGVSNVVIAVSEGVKYADGLYVCESENESFSDIFGHKNLSGTAKVLEHKIKSHFGVKARGIELNVLQRCSSHIASKTDVDEAYAVGVFGVEKSLSGETGKMMAFVRTSDEPYKISIEAKDVSCIANKEKCVPKNWIINGNDVSPEMITYLKPLISGEAEIKYKDGVPVYLSR